MKHPIILLPLIFAISGCLNGPDRTGYSEAWYYERLTPYYMNDLALEPAVHLRAVSELVGAPVTFDDGSTGHVDYYRYDIELFFAAPVPNGTKQLELIRTALGETCRITDLKDIQEKIAYSNETYVVLQGISCHNQNS